MISIKQLTYALAVEKQLHFKKAAEQCHISQSALSTALNELEKQLGIIIFERDNKKVLVTPLGKEVLDRARVIVAQTQDLHQLYANKDNPLAHSMKVGVIPTIAPYLLPKLFAKLKVSYPNAEIAILEDQSHVLVDKVRSGELDTAILAMPFDCEGLLTLDFWEENFRLITNSEHPLGNQKEVSSSELDQKELLLLSEGHCLKDHILDICQLQQGDSKYSLGATSLYTLIEMAQGNLGTTLIPEMAVNDVINGNSQLKVLKLTDPGPHRKISFIIRPNYTRMASIETLIDLCKSGLAS